MKAARPDPADVTIVVPSTRPARLRRLRDALGDVAAPLLVVDGEGRSPAAARNAGWRVADTEWVAFLDDDVVPQPGWLDRLLDDLRLPAAVVGSQGRVRVPLAGDRAPTDWERCVAGLEGALWATADMAYRRSALARLGGFDEGFPRAYREDADLALRALRRGGVLVIGSRVVDHPVGPASPWVSVTRQRGNADDARMRAKHGPGWRQEAGVPRGRLPRHAAVVTAAVAAPAFARRLPGAATAAAAVSLTGLGELTAARVASGPPWPREIATMAATSLVVPFAATAHALAGRIASRGLRRARSRYDAVLLDRDGTLVADVPYNGDPDRVRPLPGVATGLDRLRQAGLGLAAVSNQSGIGRGLLTRAEVDAVNARVELLVGPLAAWCVCPHAPEEGCGCRKPAPGLVLEAARALRTEPHRCVVIGDIGADVGAARAAGAAAVLVPTAATRAAEVKAAAAVGRPVLVARTFGDAVDLVLGGRL